MKGSPSEPAEAQYSPGRCNIGPAEIAYRRKFGWALLIVTLAAFAALVWTGLAALWRLSLFFPAALSAAGFLQAHHRLCVAFALRGVYNFGPPGELTTVGNEDASRKDRREAVRIAGSAAIIGAIVAMAATFAGLFGA